MNPKQLQWKISVLSPKIWIAQIKEYGSVQFEIHQLEKEKYLLTSNIADIKEVVVEGFEFTQELAQKQFDTHVYTLLELAPGH